MPSSRNITPMLLSAGAPRRSGDNDRARANPSSAVAVRARASAALAVSPLSTRCWAAYARPKYASARIDVSASPTHRRTSAYMLSASRYEPACNKPRAREFACRAAAALLTSCAPHGVRVATRSASPATEAFFIPDGRSVRMCRLLVRRQHGTGAARQRIALEASQQESLRRHLNRAQQGIEPRRQNDEIRFGVLELCHRATVRHIAAGQA